MFLSKNQSLRFGAGLLTQSGLRFVFIVVCNLLSFFAWAQPTITSFTPVTGASGSSVVIAGSNFNTAAAGNAVFFNGVKATVTAATATQLTVTVPTGARSGFIDVVNTSTFRQVKSRQQFIVTFSGSGFGTGSFAAPVNYSLGASSAPREVDLADVNNDGSLDIVASRSNLPVGILRNTTAGTSNSFAAVATMSTRSNIQSFTMHDMNSDGKLDLYETLVPAAGVTNSFVTLNTSTTSAISGGSGVTAGGTNSGSSMRGTAVADISSPADGKPDALWVFETSGGVNNSYAYANVNTGSAGSILFANNVVIIGSAGFKRMWDVVAADFDGDGLNDMATYETGSGATNNLLIARNSSTSGFVSSGILSIALSTVSPQAGRMMVSDMDADGKPDLLLMVGSSNIRIFRNTSTAGSLSFANAGDFASAVPNKSYFTTGDVTGDGKLDIVFACNTTIGSVAVLPNTSTGSTISFGAPVLFDGTAATDVAVGDVNNDGKPDIVTISSTGNNANVYINTMATVVAPSITSFTPSSGSAGTQIVITGSNFTGATAVTVGANNTNVQSFTVNSATQITATVAAGTNTGTVKVTTPGGTATSAASFTIVAATPPTISGIVGPLAGVPNFIFINKQLTINGSNFTGATAVTVGSNNTPVTTFSVVSATQINVQVSGSTAIGTGPVRVTTPGGTAVSANYSVLDGTPVISSFTPTTGGAGTQVSITGTNLYIDQGSPNPTVTIGANNTPATVVSYSGNTLVVTAGAGTNTGPIRISTTYGSVTSATNFTTAAAPAISGIVGPLAGVPNFIFINKQLTINGSNFTGATAVTVGSNNAPVTSFTVVSATQITATVSGTTTIGTGPVRVTTAGGTAVSANYSVLDGTPVISSFTPTSGAGGTQVSITGTNLYIDQGAPNPTVTIGANNTPATVVSYSGNTLVVTAGAGTNTGPIRITTTYGSTTSASNFTAAAPVPTITNFFGTSGSPGYTIVVEGTNFTGATAVTINNIPVASFTVFSSTQLTALVAANNTTGLIRVTTPGGTAVSATNFTVTSSAPTVSSISQLSAPAGTSITITGTNLSNASVGVSFSSFNVLSNTSTSITVQVPANAYSGPLEITTVAGSVSAGFFTFQTASNVLQHRSGQVLTLTGPAGASSYQWQVDLGNGNGFVNLSNAGVYSGVTTQTLVVNALNTGATGYRYRVTINGNSPQTARTLRFVTYARTNGQWNSASSWEGGLVPDLNTDVIVDDANITVTANASVRTLTITNGGRVQVQPGVNFTVRQ